MRVEKRILFKSLFTKYQKNPFMSILSGCKKKVRSSLKGVGRECGLRIFYSIPIVLCLKSSLPVLMVIQTDSVSAEASRKETKNIDVLSHCDSMVFIQFTLLPRDGKVTLLHPKGL